MSFMKGPMTGPELRRARRGPSDLAVEQAQRFDDEEQVR
jgi:hypothetical protein